MSPLPRRQLISLHYLPGLVVSVIVSVTSVAWRRGKDGSAPRLCGSVSRSYYVCFAPSSTRTHRRPARRNTRAAVVVILGSRLLLEAAQAYDWNSVAINGNGFIDGIVYSKAADNTSFIHTDMGGAYRWDQSLSKWMPMTDWLQIGDSAQYNGAESMAADPTDPNRVYLVAGTYQSTAAILRSTDGGRTWLARTSAESRSTATAGDADWASAWRSIPTAPT